MGNRLTPNRPDHWYYCAAEFSNDYTLAKSRDLQGDLASLLFYTKTLKFQYIANLVSSSYETAHIPYKRKKWELLWEQWEPKQELIFTGTGSEVCQKTPIRRVAELAKSCQNDSREVRDNVPAKDEIHI